MKEIVNCAAYAEGKRVADVNLNDVHNYSKKKTSLYGSVCMNHQKKYLSRVQKEFDLHDLAVEDAHNAHQRPKMELYGDSIFVVLRTAQMNQEHHIEFGETHFFVGR